MKNYAWTTLAALSVLGLAACGPKAEQTADNAQNSVENAFDTAANATENAMDDAGAALTITPTGQEFVDRAAKSDAFEIAAAKLAATKAASPAVKEFAKMMIAAHTDSTAKIKAAASSASLALTPNPAMTDDQNDDLKELTALTGAEFDEKYIEGQVEAHDDALALMKKYAADGEVASLKTTAGEIAPVVEKHLAEAKALEDKTD